MATTNKIKIEMRSETVRSLLDDGYSLYAFKAVKSSDQSARPLVWHRTRGYSTATIVAWQASYDAYTSTTTNIHSGDVINPGFNKPIQLGETLEVGAGGTGEVMRNGALGAISIHNKTSTQYTCGIQQPVGSSVAAVYATPLFGNNLNTVVPIKKVFLTFSTTSLSLGTVVESMPGIDSYAQDSFSGGVLVDFTGASERTVRFDINKGWSWGDNVWARRVDASESLVRILIEPEHTT